MNFTRVVNIGTTRHYGELFCKIEIADGRLSITGVEGPKRNGDCRGGCGQIVMHEWDLAAYAEGWDAEKVERFREIWNTWHLNDMQAGSPRQRAHLATFPKDAYRAHPKHSHYDWALEVLAEAGLQPDTEHVHNGKPYFYGSAWLKMDVPADVLQWLMALPETTTTPAWV